MLLYLLKALLVGAVIVASSVYITFLTIYILFILIKTSLILFAVVIFLLVSIIVGIGMTYPDKNKKRKENKNA